MPSDVRSGKRERAEAYAVQAAEAARRGDHRKAAVLYQAAFLALEKHDDSAEGDELIAGGDSPAARERSTDPVAKPVTDRPGEAE